MKYNSLTILSIVLLCSCEKEPVLEYSTYKPIVETPKPSLDLKNFPLEIIWHRQLRDEILPNKYFNIDNIFLNGEGLAIFYDDHKFHYLNRNSGERISNTDISSDHYNNIQYHDKLGGIINSHKEIRSVDKFGTETQLFQAPDSIYINSRINLHEDDLYFLDEDYFKGTSALYKLNVLTHDCELVLSLDGKKLWGEEYRASIHLPVFFKVKGIEYVLNNYSKSNNHLTGITYTTCTRKSDGLIMWEKDDLFAVEPPYIIVHYDDIILNGGSHICRVSMTTGKKVWEILPSSPDYYSPNDVSAYGGKVHNGKLAFISQQKFRELDLGTGAYTYTGPLLNGYNDMGIVISNGIAYWSCSEDVNSYLYGMKLSDHSIVLKALNPNKHSPAIGLTSKFLVNKMQVDHNQKLGYIADGSFIYCIKLL